IDEIRDLREKARYSSAGGGWKIYIIDEVHMLTREAFNALLKILEEPPPRVLFVFATTEPRKVPATIVSRCQRFDFRRIPAAQMAEYLAREAAGEGIEAEPEALAMVTRASGGSLRDALSIMDQLVSFTGGRITREGAASLLRVVQDGILEGIVGAALAGNPGGALDRVSEAFALGYSVEELNESLVEFLRNLLLAASGGEAGLSDLSEAEAGVFRNLASATCDTAVLDMLRIVASAAAEARQSSQPRILLESAIVAASRLSWAVSLESLPRVTPAAPAEPRAVRPDAPPRPAAAPARRERVEAAPVSPGAESRRSDGIRQSPAEPGYSAGPGDPSAGGDAPGDGHVPAGGGETPGDSEITQSLLDLFDAVSRDRTTDRRSR
ncbi:MAG TPA: AAA family ATPase, partial [Candidatus Fermentibacter sp.]|nr:AAA family ATPase [Candidatus Fermentibacter sp.]